MTHLTDAYKRQVIQASFLRGFVIKHTYQGIILDMGPANGRWRYIVTLSLFVWAHAQNDSWYQP